MIEPYRDRLEAGQLLAKELESLKGMEEALVLALPRGGVPVAYGVAEALHLPLDLVVVRKLGLPGFEELAVGALAMGQEPILNADILAAHPMESHEFESLIQRELHEARRREAVYRPGQPPLDVKGLTVILVDDGLATGATMRAAVRALRVQGPKQIIVAVPVAPPDTCDAISKEVDLLVCPRRPASFSAVGHWYEDFRQTRDEEVCALMRQARARFPD